MLVILNIDYFDILAYIVLYNFNNIYLIQIILHNL